MLMMEADGSDCVDLWKVGDLKELRSRLSEALAPFTRIMSAVELLHFLR
jgi:hypothetical protein